MKFHIEVPATTANLGPGFDCLGLALDLCNEFEVDTDTEASSLSIEGEGQGELENAEGNRFLMALNHVYRHEWKGDPPPLAVRQKNRIPLGRGLGSSASAIVAGVMAANRLLQEQISPDKLLRYAVELEGHPDNVTPALYGGFTLSYTDADHRPVAVQLPFPEDLDVAVAIPEVRVSTDKARKALPASYPRSDVTFTLSRACLLIASLLTGQLGRLDDASADRIHTPYRSQFIPAWSKVVGGAQFMGALACFISGSGPTVAAFVRPEAAEVVAHGMAEIFENAGVSARGLPLKVRRTPATIGTL